MDINEIRNGALTEAAKMSKIADVISGSTTAGNLDGILANGSIATDKVATFRTAESADNRTSIDAMQVAGQKTTENGVTDFKITADGRLHIGFQPSNSDALSLFEIDLNEGAPRVVMSDDVKAALKAELGIS